MCGIVGMINGHPVASDLVSGIQRLEYRGYDSAGVATVDGGQIRRRRAVGPVSALRSLVDQVPLPGHAGIAHTRWATHGAPSEANAHPHVVGAVGVVHNGIIENHDELRDELLAIGRVFESETDTEVVAHLLDLAVESCGDPMMALREVSTRLEGSFAIGMIVSSDPDALYATCRNGPLVVAQEPGAAYLASDGSAIAPFVDAIQVLECGDRAELRRGHIRVLDERDREVERPTRSVRESEAEAGMGEFPSFMMKEIHEQPEVLERQLAAYVDGATGTIRLPVETLADKDQLILSACGTSYYACLLARYWFEEIAGMPCRVDLASELRYRNPALSDRHGAIFVSQSGETADTLAALRLVESVGMRSLAIVNVEESAMAREASFVIGTLAGTERGVASTKAFTAQLFALLCSAIELGRLRGRVADDEVQSLINEVLHTIPQAISLSIACSGRLQAYAETLASQPRAIFVGRGPSFPLAMEGALKLKEIAYVHAEGFAAGELKHGPLALIEEGTPVIAIAPHDALFEKSLSNVQEAAARGAAPFILTDADGIGRALKLGDALVIPQVPALAQPFAYATALQLIAHHAATAAGNDVDRPRNLAKSVTVE